jgi:hypothetical protein
VLRAGLGPLHVMPGCARAGPNRASCGPTHLPRVKFSGLPRVMVLTLTRVVSEHNPIILDDGTNIEQEHKLFRFETAWLSQAEFKR